MAISDQISRLINGRNIIRDTLIGWGVNNAVQKNLTELAEILSKDITNNGAVTVSLKEGETYAIPAGYHNGSGTVTGVAGGNYQQPIQLLEPTDYSVNLQGTYAEVSLVLRNGSMILIHYYDNQGGYNEISPSYQGSSMNLINSYILSLETGSVCYYDSNNDSGYFNPPGDNFSGNCLLVVYE